MNNIINNKTMDLLQQYYNSNLQKIYCKDSIVTVNSDIFIQAGMNLFI